MSVSGDLSYSGDAAPTSVGVPEQRTGNRWEAFSEAGNNIDKNNQANLAFKQADQQFALQREAMGFEQEKFNLGIGLSNRNIDLNQRTVDSQATMTDAHSSAVLTLQKKIDALDDSDPQFLRKLGALTNSMTAMSQAGSQVNANISTQTAKGHGSLQTAQSGALGTTSTVNAQQIDAGVTVADISSNTQLGLADKKVVLDTTLGSFQADVANHHADVVGAPVAQGQGNYYTGMGNNTAGFTTGSNMKSDAKADYTGNGNYNFNYGMGAYPSPMMGGMPPMAAPPMAAPEATAPVAAAPVASSAGGGILSGQIKGLQAAAE
jgi:hypothetical protein